ncbi:TIM barrel protein [Candidatus Poribacteria bacterium]|nr:TIM barrel protein [Candidatus Poribacteria bacterium]
MIDKKEHKPTEDEAVNIIKRVIRDFEKADVILAIENHDRFNTKALVRIMQGVDSPCIGICLDTANSFGALEGPEVVVKALIPWAVNLHLKDFVVYRSQGRMGFVIEGRPAGQGQLDIPGLIQDVNKQKPEINAILELWTPPDESLDDTINKEQAWVRESVEYMRQFIPE